MTIDPTKFEPQGVPTREQVRTIWDAHPKPSCRKVWQLLVQRGYDISFRTVARWKKRDWREEDAPGAKPLAEKGQVRAVNKAIRAEAKKIPAKTVAAADKMAAEGGLEGAMTGGQMTDEDYARIEKLINELAGLDSKEKLLAEQDKARIIMNTVFMKEAARRAHVLILIPKETGSFAADLNGAAGTVAPVAPIENVPPVSERNGDNARLIEGRVNAPTPLQLAIRRLKAEAAA